MTELMKEVDFHTYCPTCLYRNEEESDPYKHCNDCLTVPAREGTHKPVEFQKDPDIWDKKKNKKN